MPRSILMLLVDVFLISIATVGALILRDNLEISRDHIQALLPYLAFTLTVSLPILIIFHVNRAIWRFSGTEDFRRLGIAVVSIVAFATALGILADAFAGVPRSVPLIQMLLMLALTIGLRAATRSRHALRPSNALMPSSFTIPKDGTALIVGLTHLTELYLQLYRKRRGDSFRVIGILGRARRHKGRLMRQHPVVGVVDEVAAVLRRLEIHGVFVDRIILGCSLESLSPRARTALLNLERTSRLKLDFLANRVEDDRRAAFAGFSALGSGRGGILYWRLKRLADMTLAAALSIVLLPLILAVAALVAADLGSVIFWQERLGLRGRRFNLYKFKTMADAFDARGQRIPDAERSSAIGRFLRRTRLDELPQLYNILIGEMSFIGPRPLLLADQPEGDETRLAVRPGLTGWAQVRGERTMDAFDKAALDVWYMKNASFGLDLKILALTLLVLIVGERIDKEALREARGEFARRELSARRDIGADLQPKPLNRGEKALTPVGHG